MFGVLASHEADRIRVVWSKGQGRESIRSNYRLYYPMTAALSFACGFNALVKVPTKPRMMP